MTNFGIFTQPIPMFFLKYKTETAKTVQRQLHILHNISKFCHFVTSFLLTCQPHKMEISQNFVAFSENMNFECHLLSLFQTIWYYAASKFKKVNFLVENTILTKLVLVDDSFSKNTTNLLVRNPLLLILVIL